MYLVVVGNVWDKTDHNFYLGLRDQWSIASEMNQKATHHFAGKLMVVFGIDLIIIRLLNESLVPTMVFSVLTALIQRFYSYRHLKAISQKILTVANPLVK